MIKYVISFYNKQRMDAITIGMANEIRHTCLG
jgi:hypothetical protein